MKAFSGHKWWEQKNPAYREACFRQAVRETIKINKNYNYFIKQTKK